MNTKETKKSIIQAGQRAVEELIKVAKEKKALEEAYGKISIDLETGEYTEITEQA